MNQKIKISVRKKNRVPGTYLPVKAPLCWIQPPDWPFLTPAFPSVY